MFRLGFVCFGFLVLFVFCFGFGCVCVCVCVYAHSELRLRDCGPVSMSPDYSEDDTG